ncbi:MAG: capsule polysaccharide biosynthesis family protein [Chloroflexi bacterium]|nr:MAG: capsule polysaccharide biosynthesis family protein [Chloroflexota bacterium]
MGLSIVPRIKNSIHQRWVHQTSNQRWKRLTAQVVSLSPLRENQRPVIFFNASTRLVGVSQNAAYSYLTSLGLRAQGVPVIHFLCRAGLQRCVLGSNRDRIEQAPPCKKCIHQSEQLFTGGAVKWFEYEPDETLIGELEGFNVERLTKFTYQDQPLGFWAVNSLRWVLRRNNLKEEIQTRSFLKSFILSAWNVYQQFYALVEETNPLAVVVFNGMFFPEAAVRQVCLNKGIRVITHEVGIQPFSAFFTAGEATAYPMDIPSDFQLTPEMDKRLDEYLSHRFSGNFTMAGIRFWPEMQKLDDSLVGKINQYKRIIPVFTNVIFDTSQVHANTMFEDMFQWLDVVFQTVLDHPESLFVIRAHPDESRKGKESRESVADWVKNHGMLDLPNVIFVDSDQYISSYDLIQRAHIVMVYNSTIGLEATLIGKPVLTAGKARYTQIPTAFFPQSQAEYKSVLEKFIKIDEISIPAEYQKNARRFLYSQLFLSSLPFGEYLKEDGVWKGYVTLNEFTAKDLLPENSETMRLLTDGILKESEFQRQS